MSPRGIALRPGKLRKRHKFNAVPTVVDGIRFDSKREAQRFRELRLLEKVGMIRGLVLQPTYPLEVLGAESRPIGLYRADFEYEERIVLGHTDFVGDYDATSGAATNPGVNIKWQRVIEDAKGFRTPLYRWKKKHVELQYGITIREI